MRQQQEKWRKFTNLSSFTQSNIVYCAFLQSNGEVGCVMLGPSCTYATFQLVECVSLCFFFLITPQTQFSARSNCNPLLPSSVMKSAWAWAFLSSLLGALASHATTSPNWPAFCLRHARSQTYSFTFWRKPCHLRRNGSRCTSTRRTPARLRTASGEQAQAAVHPSDLCGVISTASCVWFPCLTTGTSMHWRLPLPTLPHAGTERCCAGRRSCQRPSLLRIGTATVGILSEIAKSHLFLDCHASNKVDLKSILRHLYERRKWKKHWNVQNRHKTNSHVALGIAVLVSVWSLVQTEISQQLINGQPLNSANPLNFPVVPPQFWL